jgi:hypothetical protein
LIQGYRFFQAIATACGIGLGGEGCEIKSTRMSPAALSAQNPGEMAQKGREENDNAEPMKMG